MRGKNRVDENFEGGREGGGRSVVAGSEREGAVLGAVLPGATWAPWRNPVCSSSHPALARRVPSGLLCTGRPSATPSPAPTTGARTGRGRSVRTSSGRSLCSSTRRSFSHAPASFQAARHRQQVIPRSAVPGAGTPTGSRCAARKGSRTAPAVMARQFPPQPDV